MQYKGYLARVEFDAEANIFYGEVINTRDVITFQGESAVQLKKAFEDSIEDYLSFCAERGEEPNKPLSATIFIGAGPSKAFTMCPYPLLNEMLDKMLSFARNLPDEIENKEMLEYYLPKQKLFLTYAIMRAIDEPCEQLEIGDIDNREIDSRFENTVNIIKQKKYSLDKIFKLLAEKEAGDYKSATKAHWALTHAISFFMLQMFSLKHSQSKFDRAHINLNSLIEELLIQGLNVNIIDFNYDCLLERIRVEYGGSSKATFGWDIGRPRKVLADDLAVETMSELVKMGKFREPWDGERFPRKANLIKPHGDMCTFLLGKSGVYYRGGLRHSQSTSALFPKKLADISETDDFLRASIMPPTNSRRRHSSVFYDEELLRFKSALMNSSIFIIIGWSAKGSDEYYNEIFNEALQTDNREVKIFIIDKMDTRERVKELFGSKCQIKSFQTDGFTGESVLKLKEVLRREITTS